MEGEKGGPDPKRGACNDGWRMPAASIVFCIVSLSSFCEEGSLRLTILVSMIRRFGNDYFQSYRALQF